MGCNGPAGPPLPEASHYPITGDEKEWEAGPWPGAAVDRRAARVDVVTCVIRRDALTPADVRALQILENFHREDMTAIEKAEALGGLAKTHNRATIAYMTGQSAASASRYLAVLELDRARSSESGTVA